jgi:hypothetical protein
MHIGEVMGLCFLGRGLGLAGKKVTAQLKQEQPSKSLLEIKISFSKLSKEKQKLSAMA